MKIQYIDTLKNIDIFTEDNPYCKVRIVFLDDNDTFVYYSDDVNCKTYINRIINPKKHPHMFYISNMETIKDDEQYSKYEAWINDESNFQGLRQNEKIDGNLIL